MIIGIGYKKQSGKDTVANYVLEYLRTKGLPCVLDSFAEGLKQTILQLFPGKVQRRHLWGTDADKMEVIPGITIPNKPHACGRWLMQYIGTDVCRNMYDKIWCAQLANRAAQQPGKVTVTCDVRFPNEIEVIRDHYGIVLKINRPGLVNTDEHPSEKSLDDYKEWNWVIENDASLVELHAKSIEFCDKLIIPALNKEIQEIKRF